MEKVYISGPISGLDLKFAKLNFVHAEVYCVEDHGFKHYNIINPFDIKPFFGLKNWLCYMITDLYALSKCDSIFMLKGWNKSRGACIEHLYAVWTTKKEIIYQ